MAKMGATAVKPRSGVEAVLHSNSITVAEQVGGTRMQRMEAGSCDRNADAGLAEPRVGLLDPGSDGGALACARSCRVAQTLSVCVPGSRGRDVRQVCDLVQASPSTW